MKRPKEKQLYSAVERWTKRHFRCFASGVNTGLKFSRVDVVGVRDVGGDLSGEVESIVVEVKRGTEPFATASGQALGYRVYANRVYLADYREEPFTDDETHIAGHLGIGLIQIKGTKCVEILSSPFYRPITMLNLALMEKLGLGSCQVCNSTFRVGEAKRNHTNLSRQNLKTAFEKNKGLMFWNHEVAERKHRVGIGHSKKGWSHERRFICPECIEHLFSKFELHK